MGTSSYNIGMEQLISEIEAFAAKSGMTPQNILKRAGGYGWGVWQKWKSGASSCTMDKADEIRKYLRDSSSEKRGKPETICQGADTE